MIDQEMLRNGSGYPDDTAYKAMTIPPKPGEIWERKVTKDQMLIVAKKGNAYSCLRLCDLDGDNKIKVQGRQMMYTNPVMLEYAFPHVLCVYIKTLPDDQFQEVRRAVAGVFGFCMEDERAKERASIEGLERSSKTLLEENISKSREIEDFKVKLDGLYGRCEALEEEKRGYQEEVGRMSTMADMYKEIYDKLLDKIISARGGAVDE